MSDIKLKAMEAYQEEVHKGIVRIDAETMKSIGVGIEGGRKTVGIVDRGYPTDVGMNYISRISTIYNSNGFSSALNFYYVPNSYTNGFHCLGIYSNNSLVHLFLVRFHCLKLDV